MYIMRTTALLLAVLALISGLTGCGLKDSFTKAPVSDTPQATSTVPHEQSDMPLTDKQPTTDVVVIEPTVSIIDDLDKTELNSLNMLNHLVVLTHEINASKNSQLYLEKVYSELINNTAPDAVDNIAQNELSYILGVLEDYRLIAVKRERLQFIYEHNKAQAMRNAIPGPLGLISAVQSDSLSKLLASVVYMAVDAKSSYESGMDNADLQYLQNSWALDDEEAEVLHNIRMDTFDYILDTVQEYNLPGSLSLSEKAVNNYIKWKNEPNNLKAIQHFESNTEDYQAVGPYWLTLAERYFNIGDYFNCLQAIVNYEAIQTDIFRRDYAYAQMLPLAIVSARKVYGTVQYTETAHTYASEILANTDDTDWALRYFAAQTYVELFDITGNDEFLQSAYKIALDNVNCLHDEQKELNKQYAEDIKEAKVDSNITDKKKKKAAEKEVKQYNTLLKKERETALPPIHEPLLLNCELLFALADELNISSAEKAVIDGILHEDGAPVFFVKPLDELYYIGSSSNAEVYGKGIYFDGSKITIPANLLSDNADITITVIQGNNEITCSDWKVVKVDRNKSDDPNDFIASYTSKTVKDIDFTEGDRILLQVNPKEGSDAGIITCTYNVAASKTLFLFDGITFEQVN